MDATRSDRDYLCRMYEEVIKSGAKVLNVPDTVGYALPEEYASLISYLVENVKGIENVIISVHCHNDLGLAVANSILAAQHGAGQIEVAVNGIGERAGNAALEEIAMIIDTRKRHRALHPNQSQGDNAYQQSRRSTSQGMLWPQIRQLSASMSLHEAGIHQDGMLKHRTTYEIMKPEDIGSHASKRCLGTFRKACIRKKNRRAWVQAF